MAPYQRPVDPQGFDPNAGTTTDQPWQDPSTQMASDPSVFDSGSGSSYTDNSGGAGNYTDPFAGTDTSGMSDNSGGDMPTSDADFARGGPVPLRPNTRSFYNASSSRHPAFAGGGNVPASASPSGGAKVDDVQAKGPGNTPMRLNADEFVIPQDVALWKGQEFFQNLIDQSRKKRVTASAQPTQQRAA